jgi:protein SCO1/2
MSTGCEVIESALSARADNEDPGMDPEVLDAHLARCAGCIAFARQTDELRRRMRVRPAPAVPDLSAQILLAIPEGPAPRNRFSGGRSLSAPGVAIVAAAVVIVLLAAFLGGRLLAGGSGSNQVASVNQVVGSDQANANYPGAVVLPVAYNKPDLVLTDTEGQPYNVSTATQGKVTLMYFGYTNCPDVCPINMSLTAQALAAMPVAERQKITVVFVTTDPNRDTPPVIRKWLNNFSTSFIGLTGNVTQIHEAEQQAGVPLSYVGPASDGDGYSITHAGFTLAYSQDDVAHLQIDVSESVRQYTATLEHLVSQGYRV